MATIDLETLPELRRGADGDHVRFLQECLVTARLFPPSGVTAEFDETTELAVLDFQQTNKLRDDGIVGKRTWRKLLPFAGHVAGDESDGERLKPIVNRGDSGGYVHYLQELLSGQLEPAIKVDGDFGPQTEAALRAFQDLNGLHVDGVAGEDTWKWLEHLHETGNPPKQWQPPLPPTPHEEGPAAPPPTAEEIEEGGRLVWPFLTRAHAQATLFAQWEGAMTEYKFEAGDAAVGVGAGAAEGMLSGGPLGAGAGALLSAAEDLGLGFFKEWAYLANYEEVVEVKEHYYIAFGRGLEDGLAGQPLGPAPTNYILQAIQRQTYDEVSQYGADRRRSMSAWIEAHNGLREALLMAE